jgi:predicted tellurium resistance membrane protein TerC
MLVMDIYKSPRILVQGSGLAVVLKLILLAIGVFLLSEQQFAWYLAATLVASFGSHMPKHLRHYDFFG